METMIDSADPQERGPLLVLVIVLVGTPVAFALSIVLINMAWLASRFLLWLVISLVMVISRVLYSLWMVLHIFIDIVALATLKSTYTIYRQLPMPGKAASQKRAKLQSATSYQEFMDLAQQVDREEGLMAWREDESDLPQAEVLKKIVERLDECLQSQQGNKWKQLQHVLHNGLLKRNHLGVDERQLHIKAFSGTKKLIEQYTAKVIECLEALYECEALSREQKLVFFSKARRSLGKTALMLSGGGAIAMYHVGVIKALIEQKVFRDIGVISGTSGGSIIVGLVAMLTDEDLLRKALVKEVASDYGDKRGEMKRKGIKWFPPLLDQIKHFIQKGVLIDSKQFQEVCKHYYKDVTFEEAFAMTGRHVCISVAASTLGTKIEGGPRRLLLNHITTPNVLIRSAVAASCSLPGFMEPNELLCKDEDKNITKFELDGVQYVDGSLQADLPFRRISAMFSVSNFIVSQVNFHVVPFLHKPHSPDERSLYWRMFRYLDADIRHRALSLAELGLLPRVFGQDLSGVFRQRYSGHVTIVPRFRTSEMVGLSAFKNPSIEEMQHYIINGERNAWRMMGHIKHSMAIESAIIRCLGELRKSAMGDTGGSATNGVGDLGVGPPSFRRIISGPIPQLHDLDGEDDETEASRSLMATTPVVDGGPTDKQQALQISLLLQKNEELGKKNAALQQEVDRLQRILSARGGAPQAPGADWS